MKFILRTYLFHRLWPQFRGAYGGEFLGREPCTYPLDKRSPRGYSTSPMSVRSKQSPLSQSSSHSTIRRRSRINICGANYIYVVVRNLLGVVNSDSYPRTSDPDRNWPWIVTSPAATEGAAASNGMDERSESAEAASNSGTTKQAACLSCRRSKIRCHRGAGDPKCRRCNQANSECIIPKYHAGRQKGVKK